MNVDGRYPGRGAQLFVRSICPGQATPDQVRGFLANRDLVEVVGRSGGMFGDWCNEGRIPDLAPLDLADLTPAEWSRWRKIEQPECPPIMPLMSPSEES